MCLGCGRTLTGLIGGKVFVLNGVAVEGSSALHKFVSYFGRKAQPTTDSKSNGIGACAERSRRADGDVRPLTLDQAPQGAHVAHQRDVGRGPCAVAIHTVVKPNTPVLGTAGDSPRCVGAINKLAATGAESLLVGGRTLLFGYRLAGAKQADPDEGEAAKEHSHAH